MVFELDTSGQGYKTTFTFPSTNVWNKFCFHCKSWKCRESSKECIMWAVNSADFWRGGWQLQASFSQSFLLQFSVNSSQCPSRSKYPEFSKTPPALAFWMSLKVVIPVFPQNTIFLRHPVYYLHKVPPWTWSRLWAGWRYSRWASRRGSCCRWWSSSRSGGSRRTRSSRTWDELKMIIIGLGWC